MLLDNNIPDSHRASMDIRLATQADKEVVARLEMLERYLWYYQGQTVDEALVSVRKILAKKRGEHA